MWNCSTLLVFLRCIYLQRTSWMLYLTLWNSNTTFSSTNMYQNPSNFQVFLLLSLSPSAQKRKNPSRLFYPPRKTTIPTLLSAISTLNWHSFKCAFKKVYIVWLHFPWLFSFFSFIFFSFNVSQVLQIVFIPVHYINMSTTSNKTWQINFPVSALIYVLKSDALNEKQQPRKILSVLGANFKWKIF